MEDIGKDFNAHWTEAILLTWFNVNPSMDKSHAQQNVVWNYLSIPKL